ncbi:hypothetical protein BN7_3309 [Wickerhamomyces ciferrii]|uniref:Uncharacterized protein n=1 Tax=Wickerhamomyces ciferrii (strain ATCC 14091 / BCRC 22168 / CBS 111 / JCM 3599 / NBRC 0793 / NRRL Y-1031 F-60-10) TaxID=1206466 RepID=K0KF51_WICCF|nr:uncharacterized protein BN7_3309 [Wickerhamomyces ciferrii]CCH43755.1 hypothetical protein BN7_3309 [Wickerhamomyces ciferrii]
MVSHNSNNHDTLDGYSDLNNDSNEIPVNNTLATIHLIRTIIQLSTKKIKTECKNIVKRLSYKYKIDISKIHNTFFNGRSYINELRNEIFNTLTQVNITQDLTTFKPNYKKIIIPAQQLITSLIFNPAPSEHSESLEKWLIIINDLDTLELGHIITCTSDYKLKTTTELPIDTVIPEKIVINLIAKFVCEIDQYLRFLFYDEFNWKVFRPRHVETFELNVLTPYMDNLHDLFLAIQSIAITKDDKLVNLELMKILQVVENEKSNEEDRAKFELKDDNQKMAFLQQKLAYKFEHLRMDTTSEDEIANSYFNLINYSFVEEALSITVLDDKSRIKVNELLHLSLTPLPSNPKKGNIRFDMGNFGELFYKLELPKGSGEIVENEAYRNKLQHRKQFAEQLKSQFSPSSSSTSRYYDTYKSKPDTVELSPEHIYQNYLNGLQLGFNSSYCSFCELIHLPNQHFYDTTFGRKVERINSKYYNHGIALSSIYSHPTSKWSQLVSKYGQKRNFKVTVPLFEESRQFFTKT